MNTDDQTQDDAFSTQTLFPGHQQRYYDAQLQQCPDPYRPKTILDTITEACHKAERDFFYAGGSPSKCQRTLYIGTEEDRELSHMLAATDWICSPSHHFRPRMFEGFTVHTVTDDRHMKAYVTSTKS